MNVAKMVVRHEVAAAGNVDGSTWMVCRCGSEFWDTGVEAQTKFADHLEEMLTSKAKVEHVP